MRSSINESGRMETGVKNLDAILQGGLPKNSVLLIGGAPGAGKTILTEQICFHNVAPASKVLFLQTLSEPTAKTLRYLKPFSFFSADELDDNFIFYDLGAIMRKNGLEDASSMIVEQIQKTKPQIVVIDSFKAFEDLSKSKEELRKFSYEIVINLMAWECCVFLLGEFTRDELERSPLASIVDGIFMMTAKEIAGEQQRHIQILKLRGTDHSRDPHPFVITNDGIEVYAPRITIRRDFRQLPGSVERCKTGIARLDEILGEGIPCGSSVMLSGASGTGKTLLSLEILYQGAKQLGEKGILFSFEETRERLITAAAGLGYDLDQQLRSGMLEIIFIPQPDILVEKHLQLMSDVIDRTKARRVVVDSLSVFLHKVESAMSAREKTFQLGTIVQKANAVGFFTVDVPFGSNQIGRFGVEETVLDGIIILSSVTDAAERKRFLEVYKLRNTAHTDGRHAMTIGKGGIRFIRDGERGLQDG